MKISLAAILVELLPLIALVINCSVQRMYHVISMYFYLSILDSLLDGIEAPRWSTYQTRKPLSHISTREMSNPLFR